MVILPAPNLGKKKYCEYYDEFLRQKGENKVATQQENVSPNVNSDNSTINSDDVNTDKSSNNGDKE
jgi:hypothetical protein